MPPTLEEFKERCIARIKAFSELKENNPIASQYVEDVSVLLKLISLQAKHLGEKIYRLAKSF